MVRIVLALILVLLSQQLPAQSREQALLWRITAPQQQLPSYIFGTVHSEDARVLALPAVVLKSLAESRYFVMEIVLDASVAEQVGRSMMLPADQSLSMVLDGQMYEQAKQVVAQHGLPVEAAERIKPWALAMTLSMPKPNTGLFLDQMLHDIAMRQGKEVRGVETVTEQIETLDGLNMAVQIELLRHTLAQYQELPALTEQMIDAWLQRDLAELHRLGNESNEGLPAEIDRLLQFRLIDNRNARMAERLTPLVKQGGAFVAVGALHLPGAQGLITLLRQRGFKVEPVY